jgi:hypothetical protein
VQRFVHSSPLATANARGRRVGFETQPERRYLIVHHTSQRRAMLDEAMGLLKTATGLTCVSERRMSHSRCAVALGHAASSWGLTTRGQVLRTIAG